MIELLASCMQSAGSMKPTFFVAFNGCANVHDENYGLYGGDRIQTKNLEKGVRVSLWR